MLRVFLRFTGLILFRSLVRVLGNECFSFWPGFCSCFLGCLVEVRVTCFRVFAFTIYLGFRGLGFTGLGV